MRVWVVSYSPNQENLGPRPVLERLAGSEQGNQGKPVDEVPAGHLKKGCSTPQIILLLINALAHIYSSVS